MADHGAARHTPRSDAKDKRRPLRGTHGRQRPAGGMSSSMVAAVLIALAVLGIGIAILKFTPSVLPETYPTGSGHEQK